MSFRPKLCFAGAYLLLLALLSVFSDFLSPNPPSQQNLDRFYHPPTRIHLFDANSHLRSPFIYHTELQDPLEAAYREDRQRMYPLEFFFKGYRYRLLGLIPWDRHLIGSSQASGVYLLGADELGRDVWSRILAGTQTSMLVVAFGILLYGILGLAIGALAGTLGGWIDSILMRFSEFILALPALYLVLAMRALLPMRIPFWQTLVLTAGTIAAVAWPPMARAVRGLILQLRTSMHVEAAHSLGGTPLHIFLRHMLPSLRPMIVMQLMLAAPVFLLGELVLSFLNVGFQGTGESWGLMLRNLKDIRVFTSFYWNLAPLCMIFLTLLSLNSLGGRGKENRTYERIMRL